LRLSKTIGFLMVLLLGLSLLAGGCTTAKKPLTTPAPQSDNKTQVKVPATMDSQQLAKKVAAEAGKVEGVTSATAIVSVKRIYIGLDLKANLEKSRVAAVEKMVLDRIKTMEPGYTVVVSSDVDTVTRIKNVAQGLAQGKPLSSFSREIQAIDSRLTPRTQ